MTIKQLLEKYRRIQDDGYETIYIHEIVNDLYQSMQHQRMIRIPKHKR